MLKKLLQLSAVTAGLIISGCASVPETDHYEFAAPFGLDWGVSQATLAARVEECADNGYRVKCALKKVPRPLAHPGEYFVTFTRPYGLNVVTYQGAESTTAALEFIARQVKNINARYPHSHKANWVLYGAEGPESLRGTAHHNQDLICGRDRFLCTKSIWRYTLPQGEIYIEAGNYYQGKFPRIEYRRAVPRLREILAGENQ